MREGVVSDPVPARDDIPGNTALFYGSSPGAGDARAVEEKDRLDAELIESIEKPWGAADIRAVVEGKENEAMGGRSGDDASASHLLKKRVMRSPDGVERSPLRFTTPLAQTGLSDGYLHRTGRGGGDGGDPGGG